MDALGITIAVLLVIGAVLFIGFFVFVARFIFKNIQRMKRQQDEFDQRWNRDSWNRFKN